MIRQKRVILVIVFAVAVSILFIHQSVAQNDSWRTVEFEGESVPLPTVPGFTVETYAVLSGPVDLSFTPEGILYVGHDNRFTGGSYWGPCPIHRIGAGGTPVEPFGGPVMDPDAVVFDPVGAVFGIPGSVIFGGFWDWGLGHISVISPNGVPSVLFGPTSVFRNPTGMVIDGMGRLIFGDPGNPTAGYTKVYVSSGDFPMVLFSIGSHPLDICVDAADRIYVAGLDGRIYIHDSSGAQVVDPVECSSTSVSIVIGPGDAAWGDELYVLTRDTGELLRFEIQQNPFQIEGTPTVIGSGFHGSSLPFHGMQFGPEGALYASEHSIYADGRGRIIRISPPILQVAIDIKPGEYPNSINLNSQGNVPVAIFSTADFDATNIDPTTVILAGALVKLKGKGTPMATFEDVNGDGLMDIIVHVDTTAFELSDGDTEAELEGVTFNGIRIRGADTVRIIN